MFALKFPAHDFRENDHFQSYPSPHLLRSTPHSLDNSDFLEGLRDVPSSENNPLSLQTNCRLQPRKTGSGDPYHCSFLNTTDRVQSLWCYSSFSGHLTFPQPFSIPSPQAVFSNLSRQLSQTVPKTTTNSPSRTADLPSFVVPQVINPVFVCQTPPHSFWVEKRTNYRSN